MTRQRSFRFIGRNKVKQGTRYESSPGKKRIGAACIEMAFIAPVVFLLLFVAVEFARMMMIKQALTNAAREGCRHASLITTQETDETRQLVRSYLRGTVANYNDEEIVRVTITPNFDENSFPSSGIEIVTYVEVDCEDVSWLPPMFFAGAKIAGLSSKIRD